MRKLPCISVIYSVIINYYKFNGLKPYKCIIFQFCIIVQKCAMVITSLKLRCQQICDHLGRLEGRVSLPFYIAGKIEFLMAVGPRFHFCS